MKTSHLSSLIILLSLTSALADPRKDIIGKWDDPETGQTIEYKVDHTIEQTLPNGFLTRGKYSFVDDTHLMITLDSDLIPISPVVTPVTIVGDDLQYIDSDGKKVKKLKRKKNDQTVTP